MCRGGNSPELPVSSEKSATVVAFAFKAPAMLMEEDTGPALTKAGHFSVETMFRLPGLGGEGQGTLLSAGGTYMCAGECAIMARYIY